MNKKHEIKFYLPDNYQETLSCYSKFKHSDWEDRDPNTNELIGFVSYFYLLYEHDMIITAAKDNRFSKAQWKVIKTTIKNRKKGIVIYCEPVKEIIRATIQLGGKFIEDRAIFPIHKDKQ